MTANENLDSRTPRAQSHHDEMEREEAAARRQNSQQAPAQGNNAQFLPENQLRAIQPDSFDTTLEYKFGLQGNNSQYGNPGFAPGPNGQGVYQGQGQPQYPAAGQVQSWSQNQAAILGQVPGEGQTQEQYQGPTQGQAQNQNQNQTQDQNHNPGQNQPQSNYPATRQGLASGMPQNGGRNQQQVYEQPHDPRLNQSQVNEQVFDQRAPLEQPDSHDSRSEPTFDCTVQMRGRTRDSVAVESGIPWEKRPEPKEEEEKILPLPVPPPPSSTNNRLPAMQMPMSNEDLQSHVQQAASGSYNAAKLDAISTPRQAVRYKPATVITETHTAPRPRVTEPPPQPKRKKVAAPREEYDELQTAPVKTRINPKLLGPDRKSERSSERNPDYDSDLGDSFRPSKRGSGSEVHGFSWSEMQYLLTFYIREVKSLLINPHEFFLDHTADTNLGEPITSIILSGGIAAIFLTLSGALGDGLSTFFGTSAFAIIAAIAAHYALQWMCAIDGDLKSTFKIFAYSQAPLLISWIKLGTIPVGWLVAFAYSMYLCVIGLEQVFEIDKGRAIMIVLVVSIVIRGLLHLIGL